MPVVREQLVQTGFEFDGAVEITAGLSAGELVVVRGNEGLTENQMVSVQQHDPESESALR